MRPAGITWAALSLGVFDQCPTVTPTRKREADEPSPSLASVSLAQLARYTPPGEQGIGYSVNVPSTSASSGSGDIYFQIQAPASLQWVGLGQGGQMTGANIFVMYADASGTNVTLSPRLGKGEFEPVHDTDAQVFVLAGSGIANNVMTVNVRCSNCASWTSGTMDFSSSSTNWIWAMKEGSAIKSNSPSADLQQHDNMGTFTFDLTKARGGNSLNPFVSASPSNTNSGSAGVTPVAATPAASTSFSGNTGSSSTSSSHDETIGTTVLNASIAHGVIMGLTLVIFYPSGAMAIRLVSPRNAVLVHAVIQTCAYIFALGGLGLGIYLAIMPIYRLNMYHPVTGLVVISCLLIQPILGYIQHVQYMRTKKKTLLSTVHVWFGRTVLTLGIINGGLGLRFAGNTVKGEIAYGVIAGVVWVTWIGVAIWAKRFKKVTEEGPNKQTSNTPEDATMTEAR